MRWIFKVAVLLLPGFLVADESIDDDDDTIVQYEPSYAPTWILENYNVTQTPSYEPSSMPSQMPFPSPSISLGPSTVSPTSAAPSIYPTYPNASYVPTYSPTTNRTYWFKKGDPSKDCDWVGTLLPRRCGVKGWDNTLAWESCDVCGLTMAPTAIPSYFPTWNATLNSTGGDDDQVVPREDDDVVDTEGGSNATDTYAPSYQPTLSSVPSIVPTPMPSPLPSQLPSESPTAFIASPSLRPSTIAPTANGLDLTFGLRFDNFTLETKPQLLEDDDQIHASITRAMAASAPRVVVDSNRITSITWEAEQDSELRLLRSRLLRKRRLDDGPPFGTVLVATVSLAMSEPLLESLNLTDSSTGEIDDDAATSLVSSDIADAANDGSLKTAINETDTQLASAFLADLTASSLSVSVFAPSPTIAPTTLTPTLSQKPISSAPSFSFSPSVLPTDSEAPTIVPTASPSHITASPSTVPTMTPTTIAVEEEDDTDSTTGGSEDSETSSSSKKKKSSDKLFGMDPTAFIALMVLLGLICLICCFLGIFFATKKEDQDYSDKRYEDDAAPLQQNKDMDDIFSSHQDPAYWPEDNDETEEKGVEMHGRGNNGYSDTNGGYRDTDYGDYNDDPNDPHRSINPVHSFHSGDDDMDEQDDDFDDDDVEADLDGGSHYQGKDFITDSEEI